MEELSGLERELDSTEVDGRNVWQKMKDFYFKPKSVEMRNNGKIYELLGVKYFKRFVTKLRERTSDERTQDNYFLQSRTEEGLKDFVSKTRYNEGVHLIGTLVSATSLTLGRLGGDPFALIVGIPLTAINAYCVLTQRYNRARIENVLDRMESRYVSAPSQK